MLRSFIVGAIALAIMSGIAVRLLDRPAEPRVVRAPRLVFMMAGDGRRIPVFVLAAQGAPGADGAYAKAAAAAAKLKDALGACARARGWNMGDVNPWRPSHFAASVSAYCHMTLPPELLCEPAARRSLVAALRSYFAGRDRALYYLRRVDALRANRRGISSSIDAEPIVAAEREAQSWVGDDEIADRLAKLVEAGYLSPDDFGERWVHADVVQSLGGIAPGANACRTVHG